MEFTLRIAALIERIFDLTRSIDLHLDSTTGTGEQSIAGTTSGLIGHFLAERNRVIARTAESKAWRRYLSG